MADGMTETALTPLAALDEVVVVVAERRYWAENWARREGLRNAVVIAAGETDTYRLRGLPHGVTVHWLGTSIGSPQVRDAVAALDGQVVTHHD